MKYTVLFETFSSCKYHSFTSLRKIEDYLNGYYFRSDLKGLAIIDSRKPFEYLVYKRGASKIQCPYALHITNNNIFRIIKNK